MTKLKRSTLDLVGVKYLEHVRSIRIHIKLWYLRVPLSS